MKSERWIVDLVTCPCGKFAYPSRNQAKLSIKRLTKGRARSKDPGRAHLLHVYRCRLSGDWHVGHGRSEGGPRS